MKRLLCIILAALALTVLPACARKSESKAPITVLNTQEYTLYQDVYANKNGDAYLGTTYTKEGIFVIIDDHWNHKLRYFVWGYLDNTKCCDWQWEFTTEDPDSLPAPGSKVKMTGVFTGDEAALDGYWFPNASVELVTAYKYGKDVDLDLTTMDATLERLQLQYMQYFPEEFEGKTVCMYARVLNTGTIQHPYYDNYWTQSFSTAEKLPAFGSMVLITGTWHDGSITDAKLEVTSDY